jgi:hypothetical protein
VYTDLIQSYIGAGSKLAFLDTANSITIINESAGVWDEGIWYSNGGYKESKYYDAGGVRVGTYGTTWGTNKVFYGSNVKQTAKQTTIGFASSAIPNVNGNKNVGSKFKDVDWDAKLKTKQVDTDVVATALSSYADKYTIKCNWCDSKLSTYYEKNNECCNSCSDRYANDWHF